MEKNKRSVGITILGIYLIANSCMGILSALTHKPMADLLWWKCYVIGVSVLTIFLAIQILRLKEWSRKALIFYTIMAIAISMFVAPIHSERIHDYAVSKGFKEGNFQPRPVVLYTIPSLIYAGLVIFYLTRPKVKEQFKCVK